MVVAASSDNPMATLSAACASSTALLRLQQVLLGLGQLHLRAQEVGRHRLSLLLPSLGAMEIRLRRLCPCFCHECVLARQEFIGVSLHDIENNFLPRALAIFTGPLCAQFCVLDSAAGLAGVVQGQCRGELRAENIERAEGY